MFDKLFDLMKMDLGDKQTDEMKCFYERMSQQIKEMCTTSDGEIGKDVIDGLQQDVDDESSPEKD